ncbi:MAG: hypothetical protein Q8N81_07655 [bacterium]|nr:hypothetical protein [bacterium]
MKILTPDKFTNLSEGFDKTSKIIRIDQRPDKLFRIINNTYKDEFAQILGQVKLQALMGQWLIPTRVSPEFIGWNGEMILEHEITPDITYFFEWSREMIKTAGLFTLDLALQLSKIGLTIKDAHPFNLTFRGKSPVFLDYGSLQTNNHAIKPTWLKEFFENYVFPVNYFQAADGAKYRTWAIKHLNRPFSPWRFAGFTFFRRPVHTIAAIVKYFRFVCQCRRVKNCAEQQAVLQRLRQYLEGLEISYPQTTWGRYQPRSQPQPADIQSPDAKILALSKLTKILLPRTTLDIGGNTGYFTQIVKQTSPTVEKSFIIDADEVAVDTVFRQQASASGTYVVDYHGLLRDTLVLWKPGRITVYPNFLSRIKADLVLMLALVHHLYYRQNVSLQNIVDVLHQASTRWVIVEFVSNQDFHVKKWFQKGLTEQTHYTLDNFLDTLSRSFRVLNILPSGNHREDRHLILGEKII